MAELPTGTVTFLFTDVEGSTRLLRELGDRYAEVLAEHRRVLRDAFARHGGMEVDTQGDAFFIAFARASDALAAAAEATEDLRQGTIRVRMGLHTGEPLVTDEGYVGIDVHRAARIAAAGHGGQILVSQSTRDLLRTAGLRDLGEHRLKDLTAAERIYQLGDDDFPPLRSLNATNLPVQPTPFVGRGRELSEVQALLSAHRLVTLTGAGGCGKTRLALQAAAESVEEYPDGIWFVSLAAVRDPLLVESTIAQVVGGPDDLREFLRGKKALVLLDNLEQLLPDAAETIASLDTRVLATSRARLNVAAEQEYPVPTLPIDDAVALFTQRARQLKPGFEPDEHVRGIAVRLDGLPLALELAAARVKVLTPKQILERLGRSLDLLTSGTHDAPERQRTLRATIEWSHQLLGAVEQELFARLAVFAGSFELEAAEAICAADLDVLQSLVDKSLLRHTEEGRFFILATIREFALQNMRQASDAVSVRRRHQEYFLELAEEFNARERAAGQPRELSVPSLERLEQELPNLRAALAGFLEDEQADEVLRLGAALSRFWLDGAHYHDALQWLERAPLADSSLPAESRAAALSSAGAIAFFVLDDVERADLLLQESLELRRAQGDRAKLGAAVSRVAGVAWRRGELDRAIELHGQALRLFEDVGDEAARMNELHFIGEAHRDRGDYDDARRLLEEAVVLARDLGNDRQLKHTTHSLGDLALDLGDPERALVRYAESMELSLRSRDRNSQIYCVAGIASALVEMRRERDAARLWGAAEAQERELGVRMLLAERQRYERLLSVAYDRLQGAFDAAHAAGARLTLDEAVVEALAHVPAADQHSAGSAP
ncbi:MAG TPA: adenylate/guanylate cyclase domain-containing protein [Gaiellaceae bacterium]